MGEVIEIDISEVIISEDTFEISHFKRIFELYQIKKENILLPIGVKYSQEYQKYIQLDGKHRLICASLFNRMKISAFISENPNDLMHNSQFPNHSTGTLIETNKHIAGRWTYCENHAKKLIKKGINNANDFRRQIPYLRSIAVFEGYLKENN